MKTMLCLFAAASILTGSVYVKENEYLPTHKRARVMIVNESEFVVDSVVVLFPGNGEKKYRRPINPGDFVVMNHPAEAEATAAGYWVRGVYHELLDN